jgi:hypothetical protein
MNETTREKIIEAARLAAAQNGGSVSRAEFARLTSIGTHHVYRLFPDGGWNEVQELAGVQRHRMDNDPLSDDDLLAEFHRVASDLGSIPTWSKFNARGKVSDDTVRKRFGGLQGTLQRYRAWLEANAPESPMMVALQTKSKHEVATPPSQVPLDPIRRAWTKGDGTEFGAPINFRGLRHAPINEQGVVYLFGMVSYELGLIVEAVQTGFPDCEAKRCINAKDNRWQRVRIEFEFRSRNFRDHGHDPAKCDLVICWEHDWPECPIEVIELRTVIDELEG